MSSQDETEDERIFHVARQIADSNARDAYVRDQCHGDKALAALVLSLLSNHFSSGPSLPPAPPAVEVILGRYEVVRELGRGGQAVTFLARDLHLERPVVIKEYHCVGTSAERELVLDEGRSLSRVTSPFVVRCHTVESTANSVWLILEYLRGVSLERFVANQSPTWQTSARLIAQVARGLYDVHSQGIVHRDVTPGNILVTSDESPRLIDFGMATNMDFRSRERIGGSPPFMSPEQARGDVERITLRTDVFALGAILFWMLTGRRLYEGDAASELWEKAKRAQYARPTEICPDLPVRLEEICLKALAVHPAQRYDSAAAMAQELEDYLKSDETSCRGSNLELTTTLGVEAEAVGKLPSASLVHGSNRRVVSQWVTLASFVAAAMMLGSAIVMKQQFDRRLAMPASRGDTVSKPDLVLTADTSPSDTGFGLSVALDGHTIAVGEPSDTSSQLGTGAVSIYELQKDYACQFITKLKVATDVPAQEVGRYVDLDGDTLVAATGYDTTRVPGRAFVFERRNGAWQYAAELKEPQKKTEKKGRFGSAVAIAGDRIAVGAFAQDSTHINTGIVYLYERKGDESPERLPVQELYSKNPLPHEHFGFALATDGELLLIGAPRNSAQNPGPGTVYVFERISDAGTTRWNYGTDLQSPTPQDHGQFGRTIAMGGDFVAVSAPGDPIKKDDGTVYIFRRPFERGKKQLPIRIIEGRSISPSTLQLGYGLAMGTKDAKLLIRSIDNPNSSTGFKQVHVLDLNGSVVPFGRLSQYRFREHSESKFIGPMAIEGSCIAIGNVMQDEQRSVSLYFGTAESRP